MTPSPTPSAKSTSQHPLVLLAALAVILFCLVGTAAVMGWLPASVGGNAAQRPLSDADRAALAGNAPGAAQQAPGGLPVQPQVPAPAALPAHAQAQAQQSTPAYPAQPAPNYPDQPRTAVPAPAPAPVEPERHAAAHKPTRVAAAEPSSNWCANCGNIESIRTINTGAPASGVGAGAGAVLGGLLGNQVGSGHGRQLATVAGAVGGAVMGNRVEGNMKAETSYEIRVRLDDGTQRTFHQQSEPSWHTGDRVRIVNGSLRAA